MRFQRCFFLFAALALLIYVSSGVASAAIKLPSWPQQFSIEKGESYTIGVPVTQPGTITVSMNWQGGPLTAAIRDQRGVQFVSPTTLPGNSVKTDYTIRDTDLQRGVLWTVVLSGPANAKITGQITIAFPRMDMAKAEAGTRGLLQLVNKPDESRPRPMDPRMLKNFTDRREAFLKARQTKLSNMTTVTQSFLRSMPKRSVSIAKNSSPLKGTGTRVGLDLQGPLSRIDIGRLTLQPAAVLTSASPTHGKTGAIVVITGTDLLPNSFFTTAGANLANYWAGAMFTVAPNRQKAGTVQNPRKNADGTMSIDAIVPTTTGLVDNYNGNVCLYNADNKTNTLPFKYEPTGLPTITSATPTAVAPNDDIVLKGVFFSRDDKAYMDLGSGDVEVPISYYNDKQITITVPAYIAKTASSRRLYVMHQFSYGWDGGAPVFVTLQPTETTIDAVFCTSGSTMASTNPQGEPGDPIVITGSGFNNPKVHFIVAPGVDKIATIDFSDDGTIRTSVPDVTGLANEYAGSVYVLCANNKKSNLMNFTFKPTIEYEILDMYRFRADGFGDMSFSQKGMSNWYAFLPDNNPDYPAEGSQYVCNTIGANHSGELLWGFKDDDLYFQTKRLKNNWKVSYVDHCLDSGGSRLDGSSPGTDSPYAKVHWWVDACGHVSYFVSWHIQGPKGTTYY